jgi:hypothetical protein
MMRSIIFTAFICPSAQAFSSPAFVPRTLKPLSMSPAAGEKHIDKGFTTGSGMNEHDIPLLIKNLTKDNFEASLEMLEPLLTNECVGEMCDDYMGEIEEKAHGLGMRVPVGYAPGHH